MTITNLVLIFALLFITLWVILAYNRMVKLRNQVDEAWSGIDVQLLRRYDLVPNLVATVKGYKAHETSALERVTSLRANRDLPAGQRAEKENGLTRSITRLFAVAEDYPDLKASETFSQLHESLVEIEDQIQYARRYYNGSVRDNNNYVESFPAMYVARIFGFRQAEFFEIELASMRQPPEVNLEQSNKS